MFEDLATAAANGRRRDLTRDAAVARLARLARCCRPSTLRRLLTLGFSADSSARVASDH